MRLAFVYLIGLLFSCGMFLLGLLMRRHPQRAMKVFLFGEEPMLGKRIGVKWAYYTGTFFMVFSVLGAILYAVEIAVVLI